MISQHTGSDYKDAQNLSMEFLALHTSSLQQILGSSAKFHNRKEAVHALLVNTPMVSSVSVHDLYQQYQYYNRAWLTSV